MNSNPCPQHQGKKKKKDFCCRIIFPHALWTWADSEKEHLWCSFKRGPSCTLWSKEVKFFSPWRNSIWIFFSNRLCQISITAIFSTWTNSFCHYPSKLKSVTGESYVKGKINLHWFGLVWWILFNGIITCMDYLIPKHKYS